MFGEPFRVTLLAVAQVFVLGALGYILVKKNVLGDCGLDALSRMTIDITLPLLMFCQLIRDFSFTKYPNWWVFPLISIGITIAGLVVGGIFIPWIKGREQRMQFLSLVAFQNSGYLPLTLLAALLSPENVATIFIYLFLFLLGFNLVMFSLGVYMLVAAKDEKFQLRSLFNPPVVSTLASLFLILAGAGRFFPDFIIKPLKMVGDTTLPLAMLVVGGNLAQIQLGKIDKKAMAFMVLAKLIILPLIGLWLVKAFHVPMLIGLLILVQLAVPPAVTPSVILRHYKKPDILISQGVFIGHLVSAVSLSVFLGVYFAMGVIQ